MEVSEIGTQKYIDKIKSRFWKNVDKSGDCWPHSGKRNKKGYIRVRTIGRRWPVHRLAYLLTYGKIDENLKVCHTCDNPPCCNPAHLWQGTQSQNIADAYSKGRINTGFKKGENHANAKITKEIVFQIRKRCEAGESQSKIGRELGLHQVTVSQIYLRKRWKWLE